MCRMAFHIHISLPLLFLLMIISQATPPCRVVIFNIHKLLQSTEDFQDYCGCKGRVRLKDLPSLQDKNNYELVKFRVAHTHPPDRPYFCDWRRESKPESGFVIFVRPILDIRDFECHIHQQVTCTFSRSGDVRFQWQNKYTLKMDDEQPVPCAETPGPVPFINQKMQCNIAIKPATWKNIEHVFVVTMTDSVFEQRDEIKMLREQMIQRPWPFINAKFKLFIDHICLDWFRAPQLIEIFRISVRFVPLNPRLSEVEYVHEGSPDTENWCFNIKLHPYQTYNVRLLANLGYGIESFSENYDAGNATSVATAPSCPPRVLTNGFFYDPLPKQLYIFWLPLDELEVNGPNLKYSVQTDTGKNSQITSLNSVVFSDWNPEQSANVTIWSENSEGRSAKSSHLVIPSLTNAKERQAQNVWYHVANFTITWRPPKQQSQLIGYSVFWCTASRNLQLICDGTDPFQVIHLDQWQHQLQFNQSVMGSSMAVACHYRDEPSGGLTWIDNTVMPFTNDKLFGPVLALVLVAPAVFGFAFFLIRRIRGMSKIKVVLPEFLLSSMQTSSDETARAAPVPVPGNFSPKAVLNQSAEEGVQLYTKSWISRPSLDCQDSDLYVHSQTEKETPKEESNFLKGHDFPKDLDHVKKVSSYVSVSVPTLTNLGSNLGTENYSSNVMVNQKIPKNSEKICFEKIQPISPITKESEHFSRIDLRTGYSKIITAGPFSSPAVNEGNKDPYPYKRVP